MEPRHSGCVCVFALIALGSRVGVDEAEGWRISWPESEPLGLVCDCPNFGQTK